MPTLSSLAARVLSLRQLPMPSENTPLVPGVMITVGFQCLKYVFDLLPFEYMFDHISEGQALSVAFLQWKSTYFALNITEICGQESNWQQVSIGSDNGLAPNMQHRTSHYPNQFWRSRVPFSVTRSSWGSTLHWRHNGHDFVSNHQPHDCLLNRLFRRSQRKHQSSASLAFVRGIHRDRWIPRTKGQLRGKCFHLMTSW